MGVINVGGTVDVIICDPAESLLPSLDSFSDRV
jgi:hypothetical protein